MNALAAATHAPRPPVEPGSSSENTNNTRVITHNTEKTVLLLQLAVDRLSRPAPGFYELTEKLSHIEGNVTSINDWIDKHAHPLITGTEIAASNSEQTHKNIERSIKLLNNTVSEIKHELTAMRHSLEQIAASKHNNPKILLSIYSAIARCIEHLTF